MNTSLTQPDRSKFLDLLVHHFDEGGIKELCFRFGIITYDDLDGGNKKTRCMSLIEKAEQYNETHQLWQVVVSLRPNVVSKETSVAYQSGLDLVERLSSEARKRRDQGRPYRVIQDAIADDHYLAGVDLPRAVLFGLDLTDYELSGAILEGAMLNKAILDSANLREAFLTEASLERASLVDATLIGARLMGGKLFKANLTNARMTEARLNDAELREAVLVNTDLTDADLSRCDLSSANLENAILKDCILVEANFRNAILKGADLTGATLKEADLQGANLQDATVAAHQLFDVQNLLKATLPNGMLAIGQRSDVYVLHFDVNDQPDIDLQLVEHLRNRYHDRIVHHLSAFAQLRIQLDNDGKPRPLEEVVAEDPAGLVDEAFENLGLTPFILRTALFVVSPDRSTMAGVINALAVETLFDRTGSFPLVLGPDHIPYISERSD